MSALPEDLRAGLRDARWGPGLRDYQEQALQDLESRWASGTHRAWVVLPPGAGKTLLGLEAARRLEQPIVILTPNRAIQGQWISHWRSFEFLGPNVAVGTDRDLTNPVTVLTYQSLAVFDPDAEDEADSANGVDSADGIDKDTSSRGSLLRRLHPNGTALVERLHSAGPITVVLDECHHLAQVWGRLLREVLDEMPQAHVIGLTGTPAENLSAEESELVATLFGQPIAGPSVPALVREGYLAPFAEFAWLTEPTTVERDYLHSEAQRFSELCTDLMDPAFATPGFLDWLGRRFDTRATDSNQVTADTQNYGNTGSHAPTPSGGHLTWARVSAQEPELADAALRLHHAGLFSLPEGARLSERHRRSPDADDWVALLSDYVQNCLAHEANGTGRNSQAVERIRAALPATGFQLTSRGVRRGRSSADRLLARSEAKSRGVVEIATVEGASLGQRLRLLVLCDHERAPARSSARLHGVLAPQAGSAIQLLDSLSADARTRSLAPLLITGRTVAGTHDTLTDFRTWVSRHAPSWNLRIEDEESNGLAKLVGDWGPRAWVQLATTYFEEGRSRLLVGTRALLGEGWDARRVTTVVDLTTATTSTAVTQSRGRALRLDPAWPTKVAHTWTVVCAAYEHPKGAGDWSRLVRKYQGFLGVDRTGTVMGGVAQVDPGFSPYAPPPPGDFDASNARMITRAEDRTATRALWRIGEPYEDVTRVGLRVRLPAVYDPTPTRHSVRTRDSTSMPRPRAQPPVVPAQHGVHIVRPPAQVSRAGWIVPGIVLGLITLLTSVQATTSAAGVLMALVLSGAVSIIVGVVAPRLIQRRRHDRCARGNAAYVAAFRQGPDLMHIAWAVADALQRTGDCSHGPDDVRLEVDSEGVYRILLSGATPAESTVFSAALDDVLGPVTGHVRYLVPRFELALDDEGDAYAHILAALRGTAAENRAAYHKVPEILAGRRRTADIFARCWTRWVSRGDAIHTGGEEGARLLFLTQGTHPLSLETSTRLVWG